MARVMLAAVENFEHTTEARAWIALQLEAGKLSWQRSRCYPSFNNIPGFYNMQNLGKQRQCASMKLDGKWSLENCDTARQMYTICEYRTSKFIYLLPNFMPWRRTRALVYITEVEGETFREQKG